MITQRRGVYTLGVYTLGVIYASSFLLLRIYLSFSLSRPMAVNYLQPSVIARHGAVSDARGSRSASSVKGRPGEHSVCLGAQRGARGVPRRAFY